MYYNHHDLQALQKKTKVEYVLPSRISQVKDDSKLLKSFLLYDETFGS